MICMTSGSVFAVRPHIGHRKDNTSMGYKPNPEESPTAFCERMIVGAETAFRGPAQDFDKAGKMLNAAERVAKESRLGEVLLRRISDDLRSLEHSERVSLNTYQQA